MEIILYHPDADVCRELESMAANLEGVTVLRARYEELFYSGLLPDPDAAVVAAGNSFGLMDGGLDAVMLAAHGASLQLAVQSAIATRYGPEMPVGAATGVSAADGTRIIYAPTMQVPMRIVGTDNAYRAALAATRYAKIQCSHVERLYMPLLGSGTGGLSAGEAGLQVLTGAYYGALDWLGRDLTWSHANGMHRQWHDFCHIPDDGVRFGE